VKTKVKVVLFGMSEFKLSNTLMITVEEAKALIQKYFAATKQLKNYLDGCAAYGLKNGYIRTYKPYSGIRWFPQWRANLGWQDKNIIGEISRASYNTPVQGTGAQMTKRALVLIREYILNNNLSHLVKLVHVVHDAIYTECEESFAEEFAEIQSNLMIEAGKEYNFSIAMETDVSITDCWTK
jgi:DNA polymerase-1